MNSFFAPGRTELAGNHTDHQKGRVLASAVDKGIHARVEPNFDNVVPLLLPKCKGYGGFIHDRFEMVANNSV